MGNSQILILIPHPDDEVVGCLAGVLRAQAEGEKIFGFYLTSGISSKHNYEKKMERRKEEAIQTARLLNIEIVSVENVSSRSLKENFSALRNKVSECLREKKIDVLWTPAYEGGHQDHDVTNFLASTLKEEVEVWEFSEYHFLKEDINPILFLIKVDKREPSS